MTTPHQPISQAPAVTCPITGKPAVRRIQTLKPKFLAKLWRYAGIDIERLIDGVESVGLWQSASGLAFFSPMIVGDDRFYADFYGRWRIHKLLKATAGERPEYDHAARNIGKGQRVLDVGAGSGAFARYVGHAQYCGIDAHAPPEAGPSVRRETLESHSPAHREAYDVVCSFQVIEHVADPLGFARLMVDALKPGGLLILGAPLWPSPMTAIPNLVINCPPHHVSWWTEGAFRALCTPLGLSAVSIAAVPCSKAEDRIQWMSRFSFIKTEKRFFANRLSWHLSLLCGYVLGTCAERLLGSPRKASPIDIVLIARKEQ
ncbi:hypothetical protein BH10PSE7_BH10PSE7_00680 [soil metagenome]